MMFYSDVYFYNRENDLQKLAASIPYFLRKMNAPEKMRTLRGYYGMAHKEGPESFLAALPLMAAGKIFGKEKVNKALWTYVNKPALNVDTAIGDTLGKIPGMKKLFTQKEQIRWGKDLHRTVERPSGLAPLVKARNLAVPIVAGVGIEKGIKDFRQQLKGDPMKPDSQHTVVTPNDLQKISSVLEPGLREKVASTMLHLHAKNKEHEKRAHATKLIYKQAELGQASIPTSYHEFEQKLASLMGQDLAVLEKAMELTAGNVKIGELSGNDSALRDAASTFQADVLSY